ncbi:MAG: MMPL family transporter [Treponema sp.]|jgi:predicted RND superfamily exporter protein|nr:MMPL family transporter [Treponema sp.]
MQRFFKHPCLVVAVIAAITVFFAAQLPRAELDNNNYRFVPEADPARLASVKIDETFGNSLAIIVGLEREYGTVLDPEFLERLREYAGRMDEIEATGTINSIMTTDYITAEGDTITVENLVPDDFTGTPEEVVGLRKKLLSWDLYERALFSDDFTATQILIPLEIDSEEAGSQVARNVFHTVRDTAYEMFDGMAKVYIAGLPVISSEINESVKTDLTYLIPLVVIVVLVILFLSFHGFAALALPLITVIVAVIWSIGAMPLFGVKLSILSTVLPVILVAVGSAYGIHVVTHYMGDVGARGAGGKKLSDAEHRELVFALLRKIGKPVMLAALTTFAGFFSFCFTAVLPIREFGYFASFGVISSFVVAITLIPALLIIRGPKPMVKARKHEGARDPLAATARKHEGARDPLTATARRNEGARDPLAVKARENEGARDPLSEAIADSFLSVARKKRFVLVVTGIVTAFSLYGVSKLIIDNAFIEYFKPNTDVRQSDVFIREKFGGTKVVNVVVEAEDSATLLMPEVLSALDNMKAYLEERVPNVGKLIGFTDMVKRTNQVFNADESPEGLAPVSASNRDADFGFGDDAGDDGFGFGFGDEETDSGFGFWDEGGGIAGALASEEGDAPMNVVSPQKLAVDIALLGKAVASPEMSAADLVWEAKKLVNYEGAAYYEIPADAARYGKTNSAELSMLVSNYLALLSGNISDYANNPLEPTAIRTTIQLRTTGDADTKAVIARIRSYIDANFPKTVKVSIGGPALVESALSGLVVQSQIVSVAVSVVMVFIIIAVSNKSLIAGLIGSLPLLISILVNFAVMGFLGIKLNLGTSLVASVSVGIGIDYTIHFIDAYKREYRASGGGGDFLRRAFAWSGKAIIINAASVGAGFAVLAFSQFVILSDLGLLIALTMFTSALISLTVIPALLSVINPRFVKGV